MRKTLGEKSDLTPEGEDRQKNESNSSREQKKMSPVLSPHLIKKKKIRRRRSKQNARETETDYTGKHNTDLQDPDSPKQTATFSNQKHRCDLKNVQVSWGEVMTYELVANSVLPLFVGLTWLSEKRA